MAHTTHKTLEIYRIVGEFRPVPGLYGAPDSTARRTYTVGIFEADYFGRGIHEYVRTHQQLEFGHGGKSPIFGGAESGHPADVARWRDAIARDKQAKQNATTKL